MDDQSTTTEADAIAALATRAAGVAQILTARDGREFLIKPEGVGAEDVTAPNAVAECLPHRIGQSVTIQTADSLVEYANRFKNDDTLLFADVAQNRIVAAIDYHGKDSPQLVEHHASLDLPFSVEWKTWTEASGHLKPQLEFARFLEENAVDIAAPSGADLLEVCRDLQTVRRADFKAAVRTASDNENFEYVEENDARTPGGLELPTKFLLKIPVYFGDPETEVYAFLRWAIDDSSKLKLGIKLHRAEHVRQAVFKQHVTAISERTNLLAVFGRE